jgi:hypothetical protein
MSEYTPETKNVRDSYAGWASVGLGDPASSGFEQKKMEREFDRWIAAHDREIAASTLRAAVEQVPADAGLQARVDIVVGSALAGLVECEEFGDYEISAKWVYETLAGLQPDEQMSAESLDVYRNHLRAELDRVENYTPYQNREVEGGR